MMKAQLHTPLSIARNRSDEIVNAFGVKIAECVSQDHSFPIVRAVNAHDDMATFIAMIARMKPSTDPDDSIATVNSLISKARALSKKLEG